MEEGRNAFKILTGKPTGKRPLRRPRHRWEDNIRMDLKEIGINTRNWVDSAQDMDYWRALVNAALNLIALHTAIHNTKSKMDYMYLDNVKSTNSNKKWVDIHIGS